MAGLHDPRGRTHGAQDRRISGHIVTAAMAFCWSEEKHTVMATEMYLATEPGTEGGADGVMRSLKDAWRATLIAAIIKMRAQQK